jgi:hypothetical protein
MGKNPGQETSVCIYLPLHKTAVFHVSETLEEKQRQFFGFELELQSFVRVLPQAGVTHYQRHAFT